MSDEEYDPFYDRAIWKLTFAWRPHRCMLSDKWIWLRLGYHGEAGLMLTIILFYVLSKSFINFDFLYIE